MRVTKIKNLINEHFQPVELLEVEDESHKHAGRKGQESHFKVLVVSPVFKGQSRVQRQRFLNELLKEEFEKGLHALTMRLLTPEEMLQQDSTFQSPSCQGKAKI